MVVGSWLGQQAKSVITSMTVGRCEEERLSVRVNHKQCHFPSHTSVSFPITLCHIQVSLERKKKFGKRTESVRSESLHSCQCCAGFIQILVNIL